MVTNDRPVCQGKGPSYGELLGKHNEVVASIHNKACEIQARLVPPFELPPRETAEEGSQKDPTLFGALASELQDLFEIEQVLDTIIRIF